MELSKFNNSFETEKSYSKERTYVLLVMFKSDGQRKDFPVTGPTVSIGRGEDCGLRVPLLSVSRRHCELTVTDQEIKVRDLGSSNGTYLNNDRISEEIVL